MGNVHHGEYIYKARGPWFAQRYSQSKGRTGVQVQENKHVWRAEAWHQGANQTTRAVDIKQEKSLNAHKQLILENANLKQGPKEVNLLAPFIPLITFLQTTMHCPDYSQKPLTYLFLEMMGYNWEDMALNTYHLISRHTQLYITLSFKVIIKFRI